MIWCDILDYKINFIIIQIVSYQTISNFKFIFMIITLIKWVTSQYNEYIHYTVPNVKAAALPGINLLLKILPFMHACTWTTCICYIYWSKWKAWLGKKKNGKLGTITRPGRSLLPLPLPPPLTFLVYQNFFP